MQNLLLCISLSLISGLLMSRLAKKIGLPAVTAYLSLACFWGLTASGVWGFRG